MNGGNDSSRQDMSSCQLSRVYFKLRGYQFLELETDQRDHQRQKIHVLRFALQGINCSPLSLAWRVIFCSTKFCERVFTRSDQTWLAVGAQWPRSQDGLRWTYVWNTNYTMVPQVHYHRWVRYKLCGAAITPTATSSTRKHPLQPPRRMHHALTAQGFGVHKTTKTSTPSLQNKKWFS